MFKRLILALFAVLFTLATVHSTGYASMRHGHLPRTNYGMHISAHRYYEPPVILEVPSGNTYTPITWPAWDGVPVEVITDRGTYMYSGMATLYPINTTQTGIYSIVTQYNNNN